MYVKLLESNHNSYAVVMEVKRFDIVFLGGYIHLQATFHFHVFSCVSIT